MSVIRLKVIRLPDTLNNFAGSQINTDDESLSSRLSSTSGRTPQGELVDAARVANLHSRRVSFVSQRILEIRSKRVRLFREVTVLLAFEFDVIPSERYRCRKK
jgi:hypothetical protein